MMTLFSLIFITGLGEKCMGFFHSFEKSWNNLHFFLGNLLFFTADLLFFTADLLFFTADLLFFIIENQDSALIYYQLTITILGYIVHSLGPGYNRSFGSVGHWTLAHCYFWTSLQMKFQLFWAWQSMFFVRSQNEETLNCFSGFNAFPFYAILLPSKLFQCVFNWSGTFH